MFNERKINDRTEEVLNSLEGIERAQPAPFFYTRVHARLSRTQRNIWEKVTYFVSRPVVAFSMVSFVILLNMMVLFDHNEATTTYDQTYQSVYEDFSVASTDFYDYEIKEP